MRTSVIQALLVLTASAAVACTSSSGTTTAASSSSSGPGATGSGATGGGGESSGGAGGVAAGGAPIGGAGGSGGTPSTTTPWETPPPDYCSICAPGAHETMQPVWITEASGIAASGMHPNLFYIPQDAGNLPEFYALDGQGNDMGRFTMEATANIDMEDISVTPCDVGTCVYVADIGDNNEFRTSYELVRVAEPEMVGAGVSMVVPATHLKYQYGDDLSHNAETLLIHPITGEIAVVTKNTTGGESTVWQAPASWPPNTVVKLTQIATVSPLSDFEAFSAGSVHPLGHGILLRTLTTMYYFPALGADAPIGETLAQTPCSLPLPSQSKGEGVTWLPSGDAYVANSETMNGPMDFVDCK